ncbi:MAG: ArnT family glycosyltransferase [Phycisphaerales bacterium]
MSNSSPHTKLPRAMLAVALLGLLAWVAHFTGPEDLHDDDQLKPAAYVLDIVRNGHWIVQTDFDGGIASKPPLYQWLAALIAVPRGVVDEWALYVPSGLGIIGAALIACIVAGRRFGADAGLCAGGAVILNTLAAKHLCLARTDALFTLCVAATAWAALDAWERGGTRRWTLFWLLAAAATMTKGPLGLVLGAGGLIAAISERSRTDRPALKGSHIPGVLCFLAICGGWFWLAVATGGQPVIDKLIGRELVGHAVAAESGKGLLSRPYQPLLYFLARFLPWSPIALLSLVRVWRKPAAAGPDRRLERFCFWWVVLGLVVFSIPGHQRADLLLPLLPGAAVLVGRALAERTRPLGHARRAAIAWSVAVIGIAGIGWWNNVGRLKDLDVIQSHEAREAARIIAAAGAPPEFTADAADLQYYFGVKKANRSIEECSELGARGGPYVGITRRGSELRLELQRRWGRSEEIVGIQPVRGTTVSAFLIGAQ